MVFDRAGSIPVTPTNGVNESWETRRRIRPGAERLCVGSNPIVLHKMISFKPRIRKIDYDPTLWECFVEGVLFFGIGSTPEEAYLHWSEWDWMFDDV